MDVAIVKSSAGATVTGSGGNVLSMLTVMVVLAVAVPPSPVTVMV